jgi:hypothetical protein
MALVVLNPIGNAISMDVKDSEMGSFNGGEFVTFGSSARAVLTAVGITGSAGIAGVITFSTPTVTLTDTTGLFNAGLVGYSVTIVDTTHPANNGTWFITAATSNSISWSNASTGTATASGVVWTIKQTTVNPSYDVSAMDAMSNVWVNQVATSIQTGWAGKRVYASKAAVQNGITTPVYLVDNGNANYGTQFGTWIGGVGGQNNTEISVGPSTDQASGKLALYRAGDFGITLDSVASDLIPPTTAVPWLTGGGALAPGAQLYAQATTGLLTSVSSGNLAINAYFKGYATKLGFVNTQAQFNPASPYASLYMILIEFNVVAA